MKEKLKVNKKKRVEVDDLAQAITNSTDEYKMPDINDGIPWLDLESDNKLIEE